MLAIFYQCANPSTGGKSWSQMPSTTILRGVFEFEPTWRMAPAAPLGIHPYAWLDTGENLRCLVLSWRHVRDIGHVPVPNAL